MRSTVKNLSEISEAKLSLRRLIIAPWYPSRKPCCAMEATGLRRTWGAYSEVALCTPTVCRITHVQVLNLLAGISTEQSATIPFLLHENVLVSSKADQKLIHQPNRSLRIFEIMLVISSLPRRANTEQMPRYSLSSDQSSVILN